MKNFIHLCLVVLAGCVQGTGKPATVASAQATPRQTEKTQDDFTSDAVLIRFKDNPSEFVGKTFKVRAEYWKAYPMHSDRPLSDYKRSVPLRKTCVDNGNQVVVYFGVDMTTIENLPNGNLGEFFTVEFEVKEMVVEKIKVLRQVGKSISR